MLKLESFIFIAGVLHFTLLIASALVPQVLNWKAELDRLSPLTRQLVWVHGGFIVLIIIGFGSISVSLAPALVDGTPLARALCGLIGGFWFARLLVQCFYFDATAYLDRWTLKIGYRGLTLLFAYFSIVYGIACFVGRGS